MITTGEVVIFGVSAFITLLLIKRYKDLQAKKVASK